MNHIKRMEREGTEDVLLLFCICKKENDRGISGWYNEEKGLIN